MKKFFSTLILFSFLAFPCYGDEFIYGMSQGSIHAGMSQVDVVKCIGIPKMVTKNSCGCETWVYEKTYKSTQEIYNKSWLFLIFFGRRKGCHSTITSEKAMTLTLDFDENNCLKSFCYKTTDF